MLTYVAQSHLTIQYLPVRTLGVERTIVLMTQHAPLETSGTNWPKLRHVRYPVVRTELSYLPKDGRQAQKNTCFTVSTFYAQTNGANFI